MKSAFRRFHGKAAPILGAAFVWAVLSSTGLALTACKKDDAPPADPAKDGAVGPAIAGSSRALLDARLNHGGYPEGYAPKRTTKLMQRLPHAPEELDALRAFLNAR
jgi:hypothetical protein